jgi:hypothetical protein
MKQLTLMFVISLPDLPYELAIQNLTNTFENFTGRLISDLPTHSNGKVSVTSRDRIFPLLNYLLPRVSADRA